MTFATCGERALGQAARGRASAAATPFSWSLSTSKSTLTRGDAVELGDRVAHGGLEVVADRAAGRRQRDGDVDDAVGVDVDRADHLELDDVAPQLGIDDDLQRLADLVCVGMASLWQARRLKTDRRPEGTPRRLREERVLLLPARYEAGETFPVPRLSTGGPGEA